MNIVLKNIGKRFNKEWIFRNINFEFSGNNKYAILGTNGSGKSTLLQIIAGAISQSEGDIRYEIRGTRDEGRRTNGGQSLPFENISYAAPYLELPEEMTWQECIAFQQKFKNFVSGLSRKEVLDVSGLQLSAKKEIRNFSSGMKQRAKLSLAILSAAPLLLLDEPATHLDENAVKWYQHLISEYAKDKLVIVCSNYNNDEYRFCSHSLVIPTK